MPNRVWLRGEGAIVDLDFIPLIYVHADNIEMFLSLNRDASGQIPRLIITEKDDRVRVINAYLGVSDADTTVAIRRPALAAGGIGQDIPEDAEKQPTPIRRKPE